MSASNTHTVTLQATHDVGNMLDQASSSLNKRVGKQWAKTQTHAVTPKTIAQPHMPRQGLTVKSHASLPTAQLDMATSNCLAELAVQPA